MTCANCTHLQARHDRLEAEVAFYKSELGIREDLESREALKRALGLRPGEAATLQVLYAARGRVASRDLIIDCLPHSNDRDGDKVINVYVSRLRAKLGDDVIETIWGKGFRLSRTGLATVGALMLSAHEPGGSGPIAVPAQVDGDRSRATDLHNPDPQDPSRPR